MAHELEIVNGQAQMAYVGELPWHGLGTKVPADLTPDQFMVTAGLDWEVKKEKLVTPQGAIVKNKEALVRTSDNTVLDVVGTGWNPVQNSEAFEFFHDYVMAGDMEMHTAGSLKNGQLVWALAKTKESFELFKLNLSTTICIDRTYELLNINCQAKVVFDNFDKHVR